MKKAALLLAAILLLMHPAAAACLVTGEAYGVGAAAAIVMEAESGEVLFAQEIHRQLPMASTTKIMTALLTLEQPNLQQEFTVDETAIRVEGSSMGLRQGDTVTLYALAVGMLLASGNDAAGAAAVRISGSMKAFVAEMNRRAASLGMNNTHFVTPSGLDAEEHYSTAYDMALLARAALQNPLFAGIAASRRMTVSYGQPPYARSLLNHNRLLSLYGDAIGVKTGFTKKAGRCLVSAAEKDGVRLICVTLNCPDDWNTHAALYHRLDRKPSPYSGSPHSAGGGRPEGRPANRPCGPAHLYRHPRPGGGHHRHRLPKPRLLLRPGGSRPTAGPGGMAPRGPCHWHRPPRRRGEHPRPRIPPSLVAKAIWVAPFRKKGPCHPAGTFRTILLSPAARQ